MLLRFLLGGVVIALCAAGAVATALKLELKTTVQAFVRDSVPIRGVQNVLDDVDPGGAQTILLVGSDQRFVDRHDAKNARSDTMMLVRLDPKKKATAVMSIPRDLKVQIPGYGTDKINASFANGGPNLTVRTIRNLLHIPT
jgi:anionic cell wall polymer biosynthesis LytR-Cps2A-Psr (LCP) family protein